MEQPIDHSDPLNANSINATLLQRYFYSDRHVMMHEEMLPTYAFLCVGGEGPAMDKSVLVDSVHCTGDMLELAKRLDGKASVHLFSLEHRYYGESYPTFLDDQHGNSVPALATQNMKYLSSKQALADLANFVDKQLLPPPTKWVTFGGSYPGFLAAMARQLYPHIIHAAVSSSAPVHLLVDFTGYKERQAWDLQYETIGGSADCLKIVLDGHVELAAAIVADDDYQNVADMFGLCDASSLLSERNLGMFLGDGVVDIPAQNNDPSCQHGSVCNVRKVCDLLKEVQDSGASALESLARLSEQQQGFDCVDLDWNRTLEQLSDTAIEPYNWRSWLWQTCTEVGYYQTCEANSLCPFGRGYHLIDMDYEICQVAYGLSQEQVQQNVEDTSKFYGDIRQRATRVLSVNGDVDPWSVLAILESEDPLMPAHVVKGASHHFWTHPVKETDNQDIKDARDIIHLKVMEWLEQLGDEEVVVTTK
mmetsp:Transcript_4259/g.7092  ORF Transcript_4259/g.7092 Transcript_4259/m.7092 type:complete len:476 (+) Transcript_4259:77-1504(+)